MLDPNATPETTEPRIDPALEPAEEGFEITDKLASLRLEPGESIALSTAQLKSLVDIPPEVLDYIDRAGATGARVERRGDLDHFEIQLAAGTDLKIDHPKIKKVKLDSSIQFTAEHADDGMIVIGNISGIQFEVSRFLPKIVPLELAIEPDGDLQVKASVMGAAVNHSVPLPDEARSALVDGLAYMHDLKRRVLALNEVNADSNQEV